MSLFPLIFLLLITFTCALSNTTPSEKPSKPGLIKTTLINNEDTGYYLTFRIGHVSQNHLFTMLIDITNPSTWVPSKDCTNCYRSNKADSSYDCTSNPLTCFQDKTQDPTELKYGLNKVISYRGYDNISFHGVGNTVSFNQTLFFATEISEELYNINADGVFGLGLDSVNRSVSILNTLYSLGWIKNLSFSLYLTDDISEIDRQSQVIFGGVDKSYLQEGSEMQMVPVARQDSWSVMIKGASMANKSLEIVPVLANLSNNFPYIGMPSEDWKNVMNAIEKANILCKTFDDFTTPLCQCNDENVLKFPDLVLELENNVNLNITQEDYLAYLYDEKNFNQDYGTGKYNCIVKFQDITPENTTEWTRSWVLGGIFLNKYYTLFDQDKMMVGFGLAKPSLNNSDDRWPWEFMTLCVIGFGFMALAVCFLAWKCSQAIKKINKKDSFLMNEYSL